MQVLIRHPCLHGGRMFCFSRWFNYAEANLQFVVMLNCIAWHYLYMHDTYIHCIALEVLLRVSLTADMQTKVKDLCKWHKSRAAVRRRCSGCMLSILNPLEQRTANDAIKFNSKANCSLWSTVQYSQCPVYQAQQAKNQTTHKSKAVSQLIVSLWLLAWT